MPRRNGRAGQDATYDMYAEVLECPVTAEEIEVGNRVLHGQYLENFQASRGREVVKGRAEKADQSGKRGRKS
jgi:hypothetical protein